jgi:hypothetical protein
MDLAERNTTVYFNNKTEFVSFVNALLRQSDDTNTLQLTITIRPELSEGSYAITVTTESYRVLKKIKELLTEFGST